MYFPVWHYGVVLQRTRAFCCNGAQFCLSTKNPSRTRCTLQTPPVCLRDDKGPARSCLRFHDSISNPQTYSPCPPTALRHGGTYLIVSFTHKCHHSAEYSDSPTGVTGLAQGHSGCGYLSCVLVHESQW